MKKCKAIKQRRKERARLYRAFINNATRFIASEGYYAAGPQIREHIKSLKTDDPRTRSMRRSLIKQLQEQPKYDAVKIERGLTLLYKNGVRWSGGRFEWYIPETELVNEIDKGDKGNVGPFTAILDVHRLFRCDEYYFKLKAFDDSAPRSEYKRVHPHCQEDYGYFCLGRSIPTLRSLVKQGRLFEVYLLLNSLVRGYSSGSSYCSLGQVIGKKMPVVCSGCGWTYDGREDEPDDWISCEKCGRPICPDCQHFCPNCETDYCPEHDHYFTCCEHCGYSIYTCEEYSCLEDGDYAHDRCCFVCQECRGVFSNSSQMFGRCAACHEKIQIEEERLRQEKENEAKKQTKKPSRRKAADSDRPGKSKVTGSTKKTKAVG